MTESPLTTPDWLVIGLYFLAVFGVAGWVMWRKKVGQSSADYFLAGRNVGWFVIGASLFASNIGSEHLVGLAGTGADSGLAVSHFEVQASIILLILGWFFTPFYLRSGVFTMPEFLERRYSPAARWFLAVVAIAGYVLTKIAVTVFAGAVVFDAVMDIPFWHGALIVVLATGVYTVFGGLRVVLYTDMLQMFVLLGGAVAVTLIGLSKLGGWSEMTHVAGPEMMNIWKPMTHPDFPWTGILLGVPIIGLWYWCTDQFIVQRVLSARNIDQAQAGTIFAGYLKQLPLFLFVLPGVVAFCLQQRGMLELEQADQALPSMVAVLLPAGVRGLVVAGLLAALMSSLSSVFNSCSTLVTWDIYRKLHPQASERRLVWVGRISTCVLVGLGLAWIPLMHYISDQLYLYLQHVQAYLAPPITAVFLFGLLWRRTTARAALVVLVTGFLMGISLLVGEIYVHSHLDSLSANHWLVRAAEINFLHYSALLFLACSVIVIVMSLLTQAPRDDQLAGTTLGDTTSVDAEAAVRVNSSTSVQAINVLLSVGLVALAMFICYCFR